MTIQVGGGSTCHCPGYSWAESRKEMEDERLESFVLSFGPNTHASHIVGLDHHIEYYLNIT